MMGQKYVTLPTKQEFRPHKQPFLAPPPHLDRVCQPAHTAMTTQRRMQNCPMISQCKEGELVSWHFALFLVIEAYTASMQLLEGYMLDLVLVWSPKREHPCPCKTDGTAIACKRLRPHNSLCSSPISLLQQRTIYKRSASQHGYLGHGFFYIYKLIKNN